MNNFDSVWRSVSASVGDASSSIMSSGANMVQWSGLNKVLTDITGQSSSDIERPRQSDLHDELSAFTELTTTQRLLGFVMCLTTGLILLILSILFLPFLPIRPAKFAMSFTVGNILSIFSTWFIVGPRAQLTTMFHPIRAVAAYMYLGSMLFTLFAVVNGGIFRYLLVLISVVLEILALIWYSASYVPFGRHLIQKYIGTMIDLGSFGTNY